MRRSKNVRNKPVERVTLYSPNCSGLSAHHEAGGDGEHVGDGVLHGPGLLVEVDVSQHHAVHQRSQHEVDVTDQDHAQAHLHQGLGVLQRAATKSWRRREDANIPLIIK